MKRFAVICISMTAVLFSLLVQAETPLLERTITLSLEQERVEIALRKISQQGDFTFSYNPAILDVSRLVSFSFAGNTIREVLDKLFDGAVRYKARGNYVILTKSTATPSNSVYSGYVIDETTGKRLKNVSVYDPITLSSAVTDDYGFFQIEVQKLTASEVKLAINKLNYADTVIYVSPSRDGLLRIPIAFHPEKFETIADSVSRKLKRFWKMSIDALQSQNMLNIHDTLHRIKQISVIPFIGTNHRLSGNVINDYSFNILGGYALGVEKLEIGTYFNIDRGNVNGTQLAGIFNVVGGRTDAFQFAGLINMNIDSVKGAQLAGLINFNGNSTRAFSGAGLLNVTYHDSHGAHFAGLGNFTIGSQVGPHFAGLFNFSTRGSRRAQFAGLLNFTGAGSEGSQVAGLINYSHMIRGAQVSGLLNIAPGTVDGAQVSGLINYATKIHGVQVGFLNISDSIRGVPVGFLSIVRQGYHQLEVSADEVFYTNIAFRTGVHQFYNIFTAGAKPNTFNDKKTVWTFGYGFGTAPRLNRRLSLNFDLTTNQIMNGSGFDSVNSLHKLYTGVEFRPGKRLGLTVGVTVNAYMTDIKNTSEGLFTAYTPGFVLDKTYSNDLNVKMWLGGKVGIRFL
ncbi:MAG: hypothetical protein ABI477_07695 [Chryseolinea sp.]